MGIRRHAMRPKFTHNNVVVAEGPAEVLAVRWEGDAGKRLPHPAKQQSPLPAVVAQCLPRWLSPGT